MVISFEFWCPVSHAGSPQDELCMVVSENFFYIGWLLHGWCHVKLLLSWHMFCVHHTISKQFSWVNSVLSLSMQKYYTWQGFMSTHTRKLLSIEKMSHKRSNKDLSHLQELSHGMQVSTRYKLHKLHQRYILVEFMYLVSQNKLCASVHTVSCTNWWTICLKEKKHGWCALLVRHWLAENHLSVRDYLNLFNAKLSPMGYSWGPKSQEMGKEGDYT